MYENTIIKNAEILREEFLPENIFHRENQIRIIERNLSPILKDQSGFNTIIFGPPGTGKTCSSKYVVRELLRNTTKLFTAYVNCWIHYSSFKALYKILEQSSNFLTISRKGTGTEELLEKLSSLLKSRKGVIILDEVDQLEDDRLLYDLIEIKNLSLILIANKDTFLYEYDPRIQSRLISCDRIKYSKYSVEELVDILKDRARLSLMPGVISQENLTEIAKNSLGDARISISILKISAQDAEEKNQNKITLENIANSLKKATLENKRKNISKLNKHQRILYQIIEQNKKISSKELYEKYYSKMTEEKVVDRTIRKYLAKLEHYNLISSEGNGRWRKYILKN